VELWIYIGLIYVVIAAFFAWRLLRCMRRLQPVTKDITSLVYLAGVGVLLLLGQVFPNPGRTLAIVVLAVLFVLCFSVSYYLNGKYSKWLEEKLEERQQKESW